MYPRVDTIDSSKSARPHHTTIDMWVKPMHLLSSVCQLSSAAVSLSSTNPRNSDSSLATTSLDFGDFSFLWHCINLVGCNLIKGAAYGNCRALREIVVSSRCLPRSKTSIPYSAVTLIFSSLYRYLMVQNIPSSASLVSLRWPRMILGMILPFDLSHSFNILSRCWF